MSIRGRLLFCFVGLSFGSFLSAADEPTTPVPTASTTSTPGIDTPTNLWDRANLLGDSGGWRTSLNDSGWQPFASWTGEIWDNVGGGIRPGLTDDMILTGGTEADLEKLAGWTGGTFRVSFNWIQSNHPDHDTGAFNEPSSIDAANQVRLCNLYLRQKLFDSQLTLKVGQIGMDDDFVQSTAAAFFINPGVNLQPILVNQVLANGNPSIPHSPLDAPGLFVRMDPKGCPVYTQAAVYLSDAGADVSNNHGLGWHPGHGLIYAAETGWNYQWAAKPGTVAAGAYYNDGKFTNWDTGAGQRGIWGVYGYINQILYQAKGTGSGDPQPILTAFLTGGVAGPDNLVGPNCDCACGINWCGLLPSRPQDVAGVAVLYTGFSSAYTRSAFNSNGPGISTAAETNLEFTYQINVTPWVSVQPDFQLAFNPANAGSRSTALILGLRAAVTF